MGNTENKNSNKYVTITTEEINSIPFDELFRYLGINYIQTGHTLSLFEGNELTGGWKCRLDENFVNDFSIAKGRPRGNPFNFVKDLLKMQNKDSEDKDVYEFFKNYKKGHKDFTSILIESSDRKIENEERELKRKENVKDMLEFYDNLESDNEELAKYLKSRSIDINKIPKEVLDEMKVGSIYFDGIRYNEKLFIPMKDVELKEEKIISINKVGVKARAIGEIKDKKFKSISIKDSYIGFYFIDKLLNPVDNKSLFICEGETDGLSLFCGGFKNVVWNLGGVGYANPKMNNVFKQYKNIIIAYDLDEPNKINGKRPGEEGIKKMVETIGFDSNYYFINYDKIKEELNKNYKIVIDGKIDINDVLKYCKGDPKLFREIFVKGFEKFDKEKLKNELELKKKELENKKNKIIQFKKK